MKKTNIWHEYRRWKFRDNVPLITRFDQWKKYFDNKFDNIDVDVDVQVDTDDIQDTIQTSIQELENNIDEKLGTLDEKFCKVHKHIEDSKEHLCCDICYAKKDVKKHIDDKFEEINFEEKFSNLNEQAEQIIQKLNQL